MREHRATESSAAHFRNDEQVFEVQAGFAEECGEVVKEDSEGDGLVLVVSEENFSNGVLTKKVLAKKFLGNNSLVRQLLVIRQLFYKPEDQWDIVFGSSEYL